MKSKYLKKLSPLLQKPSFSLKEAEDRGIPRQAIWYLAKKGVLERIAPGYYRSAEYDSEDGYQWENLASTASTLPKGTICLISALCYYNLTDQIMREAWVAIPHKMRAPKRTKMRIIRMRNTTLGRQKIKLNNHNIYIFDRERTIIDSFRYLGKEIALKALKKYFSDETYRPQPKKLLEYAKKFDINLTPYLLPFTL